MPRAVKRRADESATNGHANQSSAPWRGGHLQRSYTESVGVSRHHSPGGASECSWEVSAVFRAVRPIRSRQAAARNGSSTPKPIDNTATPIHVGCADAHAHTVLPKGRRKSAAALHGGPRGCSARRKHSQHNAAWCVQRPAKPGTPTSAVSRVCDGGARRRQE